MGLGKEVGDWMVAKAIKYPKTTIAGMLVGGALIVSAVGPSHDQETSTPPPGITASADGPLLAQNEFFRLSGTNDPNAGTVTALKENREPGVAAESAVLFLKHYGCAPTTIFKSDDFQHPSVLKLNCPPGALPQNP
jgi:hypothetical protein